MRNTSAIQDETRLLVRLIRNDIEIERMEHMKDVLLYQKEEETVLFCVEVIHSSVFRQVDLCTIRAFFVWVLQTVQGCLEAQPQLHADADGLYETNKAVCGLYTGIMSLRVLLLSDAIIFFFCHHFLFQMYFFFLFLEHFHNRDSQLSFGQTHVIVFSSLLACLLLFFFFVLLINRCIQCCATAVIIPPPDASH